MANHLFAQRLFAPGACLVVAPFDGMHQGHQTLIRSALSATAKTGQPPLLLSIRDNFAHQLTTDGEIAAIAKTWGATFAGPSLSEAEALSRLGALLGEWPGTPVFMEQNSPYLSLLNNTIRPEFSAIPVPPVFIDGQVTTAERIRKTLADGQITTATALLGRPYRIAGKVIHGKGLGRTVGLPTANMGFSPTKFLPKFGVYTTLVHLGKKTYQGLTSIGLRPTVDDDIVPTVETFLLDYSGDLYGQWMALDICAFIRGTYKFDSLQKMKDQVDLDVFSLHAFFADNPHV